MQKVLLVFLGMHVTRSSVIFSFPFHFGARRMDLMTLNPSKFKFTLIVI